MHITEEDAFVNNTVASITSLIKCDNMKKYNVLLLGDSIRLGYQEYVKNELKDIADVYAPNDNGRFCQNLLAFFHIWAMIFQTFAF